MKRFLLLFVFLLLLIVNVVAEMSPEEKLWNDEKAKITLKVADYQYTEAVKSLTSALNIIRDEKLRTISPLIWKT